MSPTDQALATGSSRHGGRGGGLIGSEVIVALRHRGVGLTMVDALELPLVLVLGHDVGRVFRNLHRERGVDLSRLIGSSGSPADTRSGEFTVDPIC